jgi:energy-coupling factor transporter ATP-binding protein EcfA2
MIIIVAGTNGSGKTTLMRRVIEQLGEPRHQDKMVMDWDEVTIIGKYDGPACGGCDGYSWKGAADDLEKLAVIHHNLGKTVLLEGVIVSTWGMPRLARMQELGLVYVLLDTPAETCEDSVNERRKIRMGEKYTPVNPDNLLSKHRGLLGGVDKKRAVGMDVRVFDRESAFAEVKELLGL